MEGNLVVTGIRRDAVISRVELQQVRFLEVLESFGINLWNDVGPRDALLPMVAF
ncbi:hypothetical protein [Mycobacterium timonense]|uniref:Uncharacterized protein n=1 Tax=Mycobacterium timonense TaxID=701043 RepID=A0A7I9Z8V8_9MYCO|nr:hypothetical protein [Mycobacterium timonense]GFG97363.1 hypothetical protein MTIM_32420 [Mycobacterium timonense]